jgi:hypothetical protein
MSQHVAMGIAAEAAPAGLSISGGFTHRVALIPYAVVIDGDRRGAVAYARELFAVRRIGQCIEHVTW